MTVAMMVTSLFNETDVVVGSKVMTLPVGASSGTLSHAASSANGRTTMESSATAAERCATICGANDNSLMSLRGQARSETGYAMAALLVAMAVMAILMGAALPVWRHEAQREKEAELVFRGEQYVRALRLYQSRTQTLPNSVDLLVNGHFLRKKYKDPVTGQDFELIGSGGVPGQAPGGVQGAPGGAQGGRASQPPQSQPQQASGFGGSTVSGGIMGVRSKSKEESI